MTKDYDLQILDMINASQRVYKAQPLLLGGASGANGGIGGPPGGFVGKLPQSRVAYDTTEGATLVTASGGSLVDNLNHIRYRLGSLETASGSGGHIIVFSGIDLPQEDKLEFVGPGVTVVDSPGTTSTIVTISGGGVEEALIDGTPYSRQDAAWVSSPTGIAEATIDGTPYARQDAGWVSISPGVEEAPIDTFPYSRQDAGWVAAGTVVNTGPATQDNFASFSDGTGNSIGDSFVPITAIPDGGNAGQVLTKVNGSDFNTYWTDVTVSGGAYVTELLTGTIDDGNIYFNTSQIYKPGSTVVSVNGIQQLKDVDYTEDVVFTDRIVFSEAPSAVGFTDILQITYMPA
jgi:hypothetical protein